MNKIIPFSAVDGPGNRTAVFLQGCNLDCQYCHNPETRNLCIHCGACVPVCPAGALTLQDGRVQFLPERCQACDTCIRICTHGSSPRISMLTPEEVFEKVKKQIPFIRGITVSGGECTLYPEFVRELFRLCQNAGLTTLLDSNGTLDFSKNPELLSVTDGVMLDIKALDPEEHRLVTGSGNEQILKNAVFLANEKKLSELRTVVVPGLVSAEETIAGMGALLKEEQKAAVRYKIIAYRKFGVREPYAHYPTPDREQMEALEQTARNSGFSDVVLI